jgi:putative membrane protein
MRHFVFRWIATTVAVALAAWLVPGVRMSGTGAAIGAALLLGIMNALVRPILLLLSAPLILLSLGFFILVINALLLYWVATFVPGFYVDGFGSAFWGAIVIGIVSWMLSAFFRGSDGRVHVLTHHAQLKQARGRVVGADERS